MRLGRAAVRAFRLALFAFPRAHRRIYGLDATDTFTRALASRRQSSGRVAAASFTAAAVLDAVRAGLGERRRLRERTRNGRFMHAGIDERRVRTHHMGMSWIDVKLGVRMLRRYPGLTLASGLALAIAIGLGAGWYDLTGDFFRPRLPLPGGDRIVEIEMRNAVASEEERRILHDFLGWRHELTSAENLSAYRTVGRNLVIDDSTPEPVTVAEVTASTFELTRTPPALGRTVIASDEHPAAAPVVVIGHSLWQQRFGGRADTIGQQVQLGRVKATVVGIMPEGYTFPVNHRAWMALRLSPAGYAPLEGAPVRVFGRLAASATQAQMNAEVTRLVDRVRQESPRTHEHLRPRALAYGGESPGDRGWIEFVLRHLPITLVLLVACANVGTLIYARTATRAGEIATRYALGASRGRIVGQLFAEALVLATLAAIVGLVAANWALKAGVAAYYAGAPGGSPFWVNPGLKGSTVLFATLLTVTGAAILGILPALKVTRRTVQSNLRNLGTGGATLTFGPVWTTIMIAQVALTVVCLPPAFGISHEALRDRAIRGSFPAGDYLAVRLALDREPADTASGEEAIGTFSGRAERLVAELERRISSEAGVRLVTFGDRLPGMAPAVRRGEVDAHDGREPTIVPSLWTAAVGPRYFEAFDRSILAGRDFDGTDRAPGARTVIVNQAFVRRYLGQGAPVGRRVRYAADPSRPEPWFEIVGVVEDVGMTPTDLGDAPYVFHAAAPAATVPLVLGIRATADLSRLAAAVRSHALAIDPGLRIEDVRVLEDLVWRVDAPNVIAAGALVGVVGLGLFLSAAGIFALMAVSVARQTREIGLRAALGATHTRILTGIFTRALILVGSGIAAGNAVLVLFIAIGPEVDLRDVWLPLVGTSGIMLVVGLLACVEPARRALRIEPTAALKEA